MEFCRSAGEGGPGGHAMKESGESLKVKGTAGKMDKEVMPRRESGSLRVWRTRELNTRVIPVVGNFTRL